MHRKARLITLVLSVLLLVTALTPLTVSAVVRPEITVGRLDVAPTIDGVMKEVEWGAKSFTIAAGQPNVSVLPQKTKDANGNEVDLPIEPTTTDVYMGYDDTHFYLCVVATYNNHKAEALLGSQLWQDDSIQTKLSATPDGPNYNDVDFGLNTDTNRALAHVWNGHGVTASAMKAGKGNDFMVTRTGNTTTYEIAYPLKTFASTVVKLKQGDRMAFSMAQHMSGGGFYEFVGGIVNEKEITNTAILILGASKGLPGDKDASTPSGTTSSNTSSSTGSKASSNTSGGVDSSAGSDTSGGDDVTSDSSDVSSDEDITDDTESDTKETDKKTDAKKKTSVFWYIGIGVGVLAVLGTAFYFLVLRKPTEKPEI